MVFIASVCSHSQMPPEASELPVVTSAFFSGISFFVYILYIKEHFSQFQPTLLIKYSFRLGLINYSIKTDSDNRAPNFSWVELNTPVFKRKQPPPKNVGLPEQFCGLTVVPVTATHHHCLGLFKWTMFSQPLSLWSRCSLQPGVHWTLKTRLALLIDFLCGSVSARMLF